MQGTHGLTGGEVRERRPVKGPGDLLASLAPGCILKLNSDATNPGARCRAGSPMPRGEQIAKPTERGNRLVGFFVRSIGC
jgi:hypothetical protein